MKLTYHQFVVDIRYISECHSALNHKYEPTGESSKENIQYIICNDKTQYNYLLKSQALEN